MKLKQHIMIGKELLNSTKLKDLNVNKVAYLIGSIAPDLNCVYPAHRLTTTEHRFYKRLERIFRTNSLMIKSFTLGVITHYICDYFCYAHNIESIGFKHKEYEKGLYKYYLTHQNMLKTAENNIKLDSNQLKIHNNMKNYCNNIILQLKRINNQYIKEAYNYDNIHSVKGKIRKSITDKSEFWTQRKDQMQLDIRYAFDTSRIVMWLVANQLISQTA